MGGFHSHAGRVDSVATYVRPYQHPRFHAADDAPFNRALIVQACDGNGPYTLPFRCVRTADGWVNARTGSRLTVDIHG